MADKKTNGVITETGNAITISSEQISIHPDLEEFMNGEIMGQLVQYSFTHKTAGCIANTLVLPVVLKKGLRKNKHYHLVGAISYFLMMERKGYSQFKVAIIDEPPKLDLLIGNIYQLMPLKRNDVNNAILAALVEVANTHEEARDSGMNFIESTKYRGKFIDPVESITGFRKGKRVEKLLKEAHHLPGKVIEMLKALGIDIEEPDDQTKSDFQSKDD